MQVSGGVLASRCEMTSQLVYAINDYRDRPGQALHDAIVAGAMRRFRPVLLTSLTTFFGLSPMIFETSLQAQFLIPMAVSLGFGVLFVTLIVPAGYGVAEDARRFFMKIRGDGA